MTGYGESHFTTEGVQFVCSARSLNSRFLDIELSFPAELDWFRAPAEQIIRTRFQRGRLEISLQPNAPLPVESVFNIAVLEQYEHFLQEHYGKKRIVLDPEQLIHIPGFIEKRIKNWRNYRGKFEFHLIRAVFKMQRARTNEGKRLAKACITHLRYCARINREIKRNYLQVHRVKVHRLRSRIYMDLFAEGGANIPSDRDRIGLARKIWSEKKDEILKSFHIDITEELDRIGIHISRMIALFKNKESVGRELEFYLQELQRETNTISSKAGDAEISRLCVTLKTEIEKLREQARNLE